MSDRTLLRIDSAIYDTERSVSRRLLDRAEAAWLREHPGGSVIRRDLMLSPPPHFDPVAFSAQRRDDTLTPDERERVDLADELAAELQAADDLVLAMPLYNWGPPSALKAWFDHAIASPQGRDPQTMGPMVELDRAILVATRGGAYGDDTPRAGWDHATDWAEKSFTALGIELETIAVEMTLAPDAPYLAEFEHIYHRDLAAAEQAIERAWSADELVKVP
jgi:FMN-dependent NADH-azoreductase